MMRGSGKRIKITGSIVFTGVMAAIFAYMTIQATGFSPLAQWFPLYIGGVATLVALAEVVREARVILRKAGDVAPQEVPASDHGVPAELESAANGADDQSPVRALYYIGWLLLLYVGIWLLGFVTATGLFTFGFLRKEGRASWPMAIIGMVAVVAVILLFGEVMNLMWPTGLWWGVDRLGW